MKAVAVVLALFVAVALARTQYSLDEKIISVINSDPSATWEAGRNARFEGVPLSEAKKLLGTIRRPISTVARSGKVADNIPASFDARTQWPNCIHPIRDQAQCGSCWAFGATEALSDRYCIANKGNVILSPQELVSCDTTDYGCGGGYLQNAWAFMESTGVPTDTCYPYTSQGGDVAPCKTKCQDGSAMKYYKAANTKTFATVAEIQTEIMTHGPVEVAFDVYQDFFNYKSGVYTHKTGGLAGGHAVKMMGWGTLSGVDYWICANSWGSSWGQAGSFLIKRGTDECGIEDSVIAGMPA